MLLFPTICPVFEFPGCAVKDCPCWAPKFLGNCYWDAELKYLFKIGAPVPDMAPLIIPAAIVEDPTDESNCPDWLPCDEIPWDPIIFWIVCP